MSTIIRIFVLAALLMVLATLASMRLLKAASAILEEEKLYGECLEDIGSSLRDSGLFLDRFLAPLDIFRHD